LEVKGGKQVEKGVVAWDKGQLPQKNQSVEWSGGRQAEGGTGSDVSEEYSLEGNNMRITQRKEEGESLLDWGTSPQEDVKEGTQTRP